jgi:hypothetical protein
LKLEKYLSWESRLWPDQERCMRAKPEEVSFYPVVFGLGYKWITAIENQFTFTRGLSHFKIVLEWCLLICESISFFTVGSFSSFFFFLVTDWHVAYEITNVRPSLNFIQVELNFNMEKFLMLMKIISHLKMSSKDLRLRWVLGSLSSTSSVFSKYSGKDCNVKIL